MSLDLTLLIVTSFKDGQHGFAHTMIEWGQAHNIYEALDTRAFELPTYELNSYVSKGNCYGKVYETPYGDRLIYIKAKDFIKVIDDRDIEGLVIDPEQYGIIAYLKRLDPQRLIALYYH
jgi:hypothetical protein